MSAYRLYYLRTATLSGSDLIEAASDSEAASIARGHAIGQCVEVWNGNRKVHTLGPFEQPSL